MGPNMVTGPANNVPLAKESDPKYMFVPLFCGVQVVPFGDVSIVPAAPTQTN
jgi:hypothetical protein